MLMESKADKWATITFIVDNRMDFIKKRITRIVKKFKFMVYYLHV